MGSYLKKVSFIVIVLGTYFAIIGSSSYEQTSQPVSEVSVAEAMVQVWSPATVPNESRSLQSFGIIVGDGSQVLTFLDYESYTPDNLEVLTRGQDMYSASVESIDPRTSVTLLKLEGEEKLPSVTINDVCLPEYGCEVRIWGWTSPDYSDFKSSIVTVTPDQAPRPLFFSVMYDGFIGVDYAGAVVTDKTNRVLGLVTTLMVVFHYQKISRNFSNQYPHLALRIVNKHSIETA